MPYFVRKQKGKKKYTEAVAMRMCPNIHGRRALRYGLSEGEWGANELMTGIYFKGLIAQWSVFSLVRSNCSYEKSSDYMVFKPILNI